MFCSPARVARGGFTLLEVMIATALLGFSFLVMLGFHAQAVRSNAQARKVTECTYLAQTQLERLLAVEWSGAEAGGRPAELLDGDGSASEWGPLYHPAQVDGGTQPAPINGRGSATSLEDEGAPTYFVTWEVDTMDPTGDTWVRIRSRCAYEDRAFGTWRGTTVSTFRFRDQS